MTPVHKQLIQSLLDALEVMTPKERIDAIEELSQNYCEFCGDKQERGLCQCWNDE